MYAQMGAVAWVDKRKNPCIGQVKHNMRFRRFHLRGLEKVTTEWGLVLGLSSCLFQTAPE